ncbi:hypothetical protein V8F33_001337 [Rhypophila sp. PSN 637]
MVEETVPDDQCRQMGLLTNWPAISRNCCIVCNCVSFVESLRTKIQSQTASFVPQLSSPVISGNKPISTSNPFWLSTRQERGRPADAPGLAWSFHSERTPPGLSFHRPLSTLCHPSPVPPVPRRVFDYSWPSIWSFFPNPLFQNFPFQFLLSLLLARDSFGVPPPPFNREPSTNILIFVFAAGSGGRQLSSLLSSLPLRAVRSVLRSSPSLLLSIAPHLLSQEQLRGFVENSGYFCQISPLMGKFHASCIVIKPSTPPTFDFSFEASPVTAGVFESLARNPLFVS